MTKYRKKPVVIEAVLWTGENVTEIAEFMTSASCGFTTENELRIHTLEGTLEARVGDYVIKGVKGEFYPCKPDIFAATYELVQE